MSKSFAKLVKAEEARAKREQAKQPYVQPLRPRATVFKTGKEYSRQKAKQEGTRTRHSGRQPVSGPGNR